MSNVRRVPAPPPPEPAPDWRIARAVSLEIDATRIDAALAHVTEIEELLAEDEDVVHALRVSAALLRCRRNDRLDHSSRLRAALEEATTTAAAA